MTIMESGELAAKKIGSVVPDQAQRGGRVSGEVNLEGLTEGTEKTETFTNGGTELTRDERRRGINSDVGGH